MSYTPTTWKSGDTVTSTKLNKIEQGIANNILFVNGTVSYTEAEDDEDSTQMITLNKTWQEIVDAANNGIVIIKVNFSYDDATNIAFTFVSGYYHYNSSNGYTIYTDDKTFTAESADGYPIYVDEVNLR